MDIIKISAICLITALLALFLKSYKNEYAMLVSLAGGIVISLSILKYLMQPINELKEILENTGVNLSFFKIALKALGIGYISGFIADTCRENGQISMASKVEFAGRVAIFILCIPLIASITETAIGFLQ